VHSDDFTRGYGPEEYITRKAIKGRYEISADYFGSDSVTLLGPHYVIGAICFEAPSKTSADGAWQRGTPNDDGTPRSAGYGFTTFTM